MAALGRPRRWRTEEGVTLTELLVVMSIMLVVGGIVMSGTVAAMRTASRGEARVESLLELQTAVQRVSREIRAANPLVIFPGDIRTQLGAEVQRDGKLHVFTYGIDGDRFVADLGVFALSDTGRTTPLPGSFADQVLIDGISSIRFDYYDTHAEDLNGDGLDDPIACDPATIADAAARSTCIAQLQNAASVRLEFERLIPGQSPQTVETRVALRNR